MEKEPRPFPIIDGSYEWKMVPLCWVTTEGIEDYPQIVPVQGGDFLEND